jgi:CRISPR-associated endoribonuclease Cas6
VRVRIIFTTENKGALVPFHHQHLITEVFDGIFKELYFIKKDNFYNFSGLKGQTKVTPNGLQYFSSRVTIVFSSQSDQLVDEFLKALFKRERIKIGELSIVPETVEKESEVELGDANKYLCISPIVICNPKFTPDLDCKKFISPMSDQFSDILYESTMAMMEQSGKYTADEIASFFKFQIVPDKDYLAKIKEGDKKFARIYSLFEGDNIFEVRGYTFPFTLYAHPKVHEFVFNNGVGTFCNKGFGMLDIASANIKKTTSTYQVIAA